MHIRAITAQDAPLLKESTLLSVLEAPYAFGGTETHTQEAALPDSHWQTFAAELAGDVPEWRDRCVGYFLLDGISPSPWGKIICTLAIRNPKLALISGMWIAPNHRRRGHGKALVETVTTWAAAHGAERLKLWVDDTNPTAVTFYESLRFVPTGDSRPTSPNAPALERSFVKQLGT